MISGTSKMSLNLDPINGQIWTRGPRIYGFYYTKILHKILERIWEHPGTHYLWKSETHFSIGGNKYAIVCFFGCSNVF